LVVGLQPGRHAGDLLGGLARRGLDGRTRPDGHPRPRRDRRGGDVEPAAVDLDVAVYHELAGLAPGRGQPEAEDDVVEARLEGLKERLPGGAVAAPAGPGDEAAHLALAHAVGDFQLLGLAQLAPVDALGAAAAGAVLARVRGA